MKVIIKNVYVDLGSIMRIEKRVQLINGEPSVVLTNFVKEQIEIPFDKFSFEDSVKPTEVLKITESNLKTFQKEYLHTDKFYLKPNSETKTVKVYLKSDIEDERKRYENRFEDFYQDIINMWKESDSNIKLIQ